MKNYLQPLIKAFESNGNPERAAGAAKYLKNQFDFLGLSATDRRRLMKDFFREHGYPRPAELREFSLCLWNLPEREYQHVVVDTLRKMAEKLRREDIQWIETLIREKSWWDTVDGLAAWIVGAYFKMYPQQIPPVTQRWIESGNMWLQRTCLLFQLNYRETTDTALLTVFIEKLAGHKDFFIRKAIGWILRQYSKTDKEWVRGFMDSHELSGLSVREGSKYL